MKSIKTKKPVSVENQIKISNVTSFMYVLMIIILGVSVVKAVTIGTWMLVMWLLSVVFLMAMLFKENEKRKYLKELL